ncbi:MAG: D-alanyl-D-alanine carboxypeptidase/D-alanyl-D-alanine endopeptidase [Planctomycetota bacterium]|jgi:D-alanyl-D-alanine carboxypeptidase/D-alanyl-D-alanine-endopeptidase (penicillin-binding protein 4)
MTHVAALLLAALLQAQDLGAKIDRLVSDAGPADARVGIVVASSAQGKILHRRAAREPFLLASNTKLFTCAAALDRLGPDHALVTEVHVRNLREGAADALVVTGDGDPHISGRDHDGNPAAVFEQWAAALKKRGVAKIDGPVILVADKFEEEGTYPEWDRYPVDRWWAAPYGQFSLSDSCLDVTYAPGKKAGDPARLTIRPDTRFVTVRNKSTTVQGKEKIPFQFIRKPGTNEILFRGNCTLKAQPRKTWIAIRDPQRFFGTVLKETLEKAGVRVTGGVEIVRKRPEGLTAVARHGTKLRRVLEVCMKNSQNFYAEMLLHHLAWKVKGRGTRAKGIEAVAEFLAGIGIEGVEQKDASGLARGNRASPLAVVALLRYMQKHRHAEAFRRALAVSGAKKGTLRRRMRDEPYRGRVRAKTGHLAGVTALSGYVEARSGDTYVVSILVNVPGEGSTGKADKLQNRICEMLIDLD